MAEADPGIFAAMAAIPEIAVASPAELDQRLRDATEPFVVRGLVADWPLVAAGRQSSHAAREHILAHRRDLPFTVSVGKADTGGRLFYDDALGMNFQTVRA